MMRKSASSNIHQRYNLHGSIVDEDAFAVGIVDDNCYDFAMTHPENLLKAFQINHTSAFLFSNDSEHVPGTIVVGSRVYDKADGQPARVCELIHITDEDRLDQMKASNVLFVPLSCVLICLPDKERVTLARHASYHSNNMPREVLHVCGPLLWNNQLVSVRSVAKLLSSVGIACVQEQPHLKHQVTISNAERSTLYPFSVVMQLHNLIALQGGDIQIKLAQALDQIASQTSSSSTTERNKLRNRKVKESHEEEEEEEDDMSKSAAEALERLKIEFQQRQQQRGQSEVVKVESNGDKQPLPSVPTTTTTTTTSTPRIEGGNPFSSPSSSSSFQMLF